MTADRPTSAPATARARARAQLTDEIKGAARRQLAETGSSGLSLRAVARELGMVSSAVYRYFASRDELLTALIIDAYEAVAAEAEVALAKGSFATRWLAMGRAVRRWAIANPHEYALVYGSPVPGYRAPQDTVPAAERVSRVPLTLLHDGVAAGELHADPDATAPRSIRPDLARIRDAYAPGVPDDVLSRGLGAWMQLFGTISFELFGHLHGVIDDADAFFDHQLRAAARHVAGE